MEGLAYEHEVMKSTLLFCPRKSKFSFKGDVIKFASSVVLHKGQVLKILGWRFVGRSASNTSA